MTITQKFRKQIDDTAKAFDQLQGITEGLKGLSEQLVPTTRLNGVVDERLLPIIGDINNLRTAVNDLVQSSLNVQETRIMVEQVSGEIIASLIGTYERRLTEVEAGAARKIEQFARQVSKMQRRLDRMHEATSALENE